VKWPDDFIDRVICGDCLEVMKKIPDQSIDTIITDPPYGFGRFAGDDKKSFMQIIHGAFIEIKRILKNGGWAFVCSGTGELKNLFEAIPLNYQRLLWIYKPADCTFPYRGWLLTSEAIALFSNGSPSVLAARIGNYMHDVYIHKAVGQEGVDGHPTVKPLWIIKDLCSRTMGIILDPFLGSGTTAVAAKSLGRHFIGIEINPDYCKIAENRLVQTGQQLELMEL
jgi:DNA modification methylase